jgi:hypothetical protein
MCNIEDKPKTKTKRPMTQKIKDPEKNPTE